jgi:hypothetical protein
MLNILILIAIDILLIIAAIIYIMDKNAQRHARNLNILKEFTNMKLRESIRLIKASAPQPKPAEKSFSDKVDRILHLSGLPPVGFFLRMNNTNKEDYYNKRDALGRFVKANGEQEGYIKPNIKGRDAHGRFKKVS